MVAPCDLVQSNTNILIYNEVVGSWSDDYLTYNCYGYAIDYHDKINPGEIEWKNLGNTADHLFSIDANVLTLAYDVCDDLESMNYTVSTPSLTLPSVTVSEHTRLICIRKDNDGSDFHFMKLEEDGYWYHKPGLTNPLRYTHILSSAHVWLGEWYFQVDGTDVYLQDFDHSYESEIYFITYSIPHTNEYYKYFGSTGNTHYHIKSCRECGESIGSKIACVYKNGSSTCTACKHNKNSVITYAVPTLYESVME